MIAGAPTLAADSIPGDAGGLQAIGRRLADASSDVAGVRDRVAANGLQDWTGQAADSFRVSLERLPGELGRAAAAFDDACGAIIRFSGELAGFQDRATRYAARISELEDQAAGAQLRHDEAQSKVDACRTQQASATDPASVKAAGDALQMNLGMWRQALHELEDHRSEIAGVRRAAHENRDEYDRAVSTCCATFDAAQETVAATSFPG